MTWRALSISPYIVLTNVPPRAIGGISFEPAAGGVEFNTSFTVECGQWAGAIPLLHFSPQPGPARFCHLKYTQGRTGARAKAWCLLIYGKRLSLTQNTP